MTELTPLEQKINNAKDYFNSQIDDLAKTRLEIAATIYEMTFDELVHFLREGEMHPDFVNSLVIKVRRELRINGQVVYDDR